jgi:hypothetical protein
MEPYLEGPLRNQFDHWHANLVERFQRDLTFPEIRKGVQAVSSSYVRQKRGNRGGADTIFDGAGKRAAFALYYGPFHFLMTYHIVREIGFHELAPRSIQDIGCGTGVAGAAWAAAIQEHPVPADKRVSRAKIKGLERVGFAMEEARLTYRAFSLQGEVKKMDLERELPRGKGAAVLAFTANELTEPARDRLLNELSHPFLRPLLVLEPLARKIAPWWSAWERKLGESALAVHAFEWRKRIELPKWLATMDKAAGIDHSELTARVLGLMA